MAGTTELQPAALESGTEALWYFPDVDVHGADSFEYRATDCPGDRLRSSLPATVSVQVAPVNDPPREAYESFPSVSTANPAGELITLPVVDVDDNVDQLQLVLLSLPTCGQFFYENPANEEPPGLIDDDADEGGLRAAPRALPPSPPQLCRAHLACCPHRDAPSPTLTRGALSAAGEADDDLPVSAAVLPKRLQLGRRTLWFVPPASLSGCSTLAELQAAFDSDGASFAASRQQLWDQAVVRLKESSTRTGFALLRYRVLDPSGGAVNQTFAIVVTQPSIAKSFVSLATMMGLTGLLLLVLCCGLLRRCYRQHAKREHNLRLHEEHQEQRVHKAIENSRTLTFPCVLLRARDFASLGGLKPFEELRGLHTHIDGMEALSGGTDVKVVFFSHEWTSREHPDHTGAQYQVMKVALDHVVRSMNWQGDDVRVWVDYASTPQANVHTQRLAINSFVHYASCAHAFVVVAPPVIHKDRGVLCNMSSYRKRMWCRAEQLSHFLRNGRDSMWVATSESGLEDSAGADNEVESAVGEEETAAEEREEERDGVGKAGANESNVRVGKMATWEGGSGGSWHHEFLRVFAGDATVETDKISLVLPLLGLYGELLSSAGGNLSAAHLARIDEVLCEIMTCREEIFPPLLHVAAGKLVELAHCPAGISTAKAGSARGASPKGGSASSSKAASARTAPLEVALELELFGDLIDRMERRLEIDHATREQYLETVRRRAVAVAANAFDLPKKKGHRRQHVNLERSYGSNSSLLRSPRSSDATRSPRGSWISYRPSLGRNATPRNSHSSDPGHPCSPCRRVEPSASGSKHHGGASSLLAWATGHALRRRTLGELGKVESLQGPAPPPAANLADAHLVKVDSILFAHV